MTNNLYVQYGCGWSAPIGWLNFDGSPTLKFERIPIIGKLYTKNKLRFPDNVLYGNVLKTLPVGSSQVTGLYCSHVLEHLSYCDLKVALNESYRLLEKGGIFRLVLPDLEYMINKYTAYHNTSVAPAISFMKETDLGVEKRDKTFIDIIKSRYGGSKHLWMWDYKSLSLELKNAGFVEIRRAYYNDSTDPNFKKVESKKRWDNCLGIECKK